MAKFVYDKKKYALNIHAISESEVNAKEIQQILSDLSEIQIINYYVDKNLVRVYTLDGGELMLLKRNAAAPQLPAADVFKKIIKTEIPISQVRRSSDSSVVICGEVTYIDKIKTKRDDKYLVVLGIADFDDGISAKSFFENEETADIVTRNILVGSYVKVMGRLTYDNFENDYVLMFNKINLANTSEGRMDGAKRKRVELHLHTNMSEQDGMCPLKEYAERALKWGFPAIAVTDNSSVQGFDQAFSLGKDLRYKFIYGMDAYVVDDVRPFLGGISDEYPFNGDFVVFDIETTGFSARNDRIIEFVAVKVSGGAVVDRFSSFVFLGKPLSKETVELTNITDEMLAGAPDIDKVFDDFMKFSDGSVFVAHNSDFDMSFVNKLCAEKGVPLRPAIDTIQLARQFLPIKKYGLETLVRHLKIPFSDHHRAVADAEVTAKAFIHFLGIFKELGLTTVGQLNRYVRENIAIEKFRPEKMLILLRGPEGRSPLYKLLSSANINYGGNMRLSELLEQREHFLLGSGAEDGALYDAALMNKSDSEIKSLMGYYDFVELMPAANFYVPDHGVGTDYFNSENQVRELFLRLHMLASELGIRTVATGDVFFAEPSEMIARDIMLHSRTRRSFVNRGLKYLRTTEEMLQEFSYLGSDAEKVVIDNSIYFASLTSPIQPVPSGTYSPTLEGAEEELKRICYSNARKIYGDQLPQIVEARLSRELHAIIENGYGSLYLISNKMVKKSNEDGYLVGSRGSVGSSLAAFLGGISDVNPLPPHYHCEKCRVSEFSDDTSIVGFDLPMKTCILCGETLKRNGCDIPFEAFLGFKGDKEPDIDLNFASVYQSTAQKYCEELFGKGHTFKAGTVGTYAEKTAIGNVKKYLEDNGKNWPRALIMKHSKRIQGVKRATGQHPAGVLVLPKEYDINYFSPIFLAKIEGGAEYAQATHFDYGMLKGTLLKLDVLGHESPTALRMLGDYTGVDVMDIRLDDPATISIFKSADALNIRGSEPDDVGALGIPEFGTHFVLGMLKTTRPNNVTDLVRISGLSHGTMVWKDNAEDDVRSGRVPFGEVIATREDIMNKLIAKGCDAQTAFQIMEKVRKGKGVDDKDLAELKKVQMPDWYIESCQKISYLFPKAHAAAYVMQSIRIAYFKVHYPLAFYATFFSLNVSDFDFEVVRKGEQALERLIPELDKIDSSAKDRASAQVYKVVVEMFKRGYEFVNVDLMESDSTKFRIVDGKLQPPLQAIRGVAESAANSIVAAREEYGGFLSVEDFQSKTGINKTALEGLSSTGAFDGLSMTNQLSFF